jgi:hypothetical protein
LTAAALLTTITRLPGRSGFCSASRSRANVIFDVAVPIDREGFPGLLVQRGGDEDGAGDKDEHIRGVSPEHARRHRRVGRTRDLGSDVVLVAASSASSGVVRAMATTGAPAAANARAIPRPSPRLAPTTTVLFDKSFMVVRSLWSLDDRDGDRGRGFAVADDE